MKRFPLLLLVVVLPGCGSQSNDRGSNAPVAGVPTVRDEVLQTTEDIDASIDAEDVAATPPPETAESQEETFPAPSSDNHVEAHRIIDEPQYLPVEDLIASTAQVVIELAREEYQASDTTNDPGEPDRQANVNRQGRNYPFVSVRGVFPFKDQIDRYVDATHTDRAYAIRDFMLVDFVLERQELGVDGNEWSDWQQADLNVLRTVIQSASGIEADVVKSAATDSVITCPLPTRLTDRWHRHATHPRLKEFELSEDENELELQFNRALPTELVELELQLHPRSFDELLDPEKGEDLLQDLDQEAEFHANQILQAELFDHFAGRTGPGGVNLYLERFVLLLASQFDINNMSYEDLRDWIRERVTLKMELLLFRYLDFDIIPGRTYRYRVRLELKNPNFARPVTRATGPNVVEGATRLTPWSDPTEPVRVSETVSDSLPESTGTDAQP